jgi:hypothetical protein
LNVSIIKHSSAKFRKKRTVISRRVEFCCGKKKLNKLSAGRKQNVSLYTSFIKEKWNNE